MSGVRVSYYSDILCVWAYVGQRRLEQLSVEFAQKINIETRFCSVFPDVEAKMEQSWKARGGYEGFNRHTLEVAKKFPHVEINPRLWLDAKPLTSASGHIFLKAMEVVEQERYGDDLAKQTYLERLSSKAAWQIRLAFFAEGKDISNWGTHMHIAEDLGVKTALIEEKIHNGQAVALLAADYDLAQKNNIVGSPTYFMNEGRQKLFGNVGYRLLQANISELLHNPTDEEASWC
ncbi:DsbA-like thioredoxin domain protein [hydrothermal vent metagenome]|uniref:DsbA-like thioredoxin domain protein n=1 Tax=hydrothermal vent metagenome TaxID=652676 RepID=A0A3B0U265_9ZZZZ